MSTETMQSEALRAALDFEQRGHDYYKDIAEHAENPLTKTVFSSLAGEELMHMERIRQLYSETGAGQAVSAPECSLEERVRIVFEESKLTERQAWTMDNAAAYDYATELEREGYALYAKLAEETQSPEEREFFRRLQVEELNHLSALQNVHSYLEHTADWFAREEVHVWNWMNM